MNDAAGNAATEASVNAWYDVTDPTTTIGSIDISADTGSSDTDFITKTAGQTVTATLSAALASDETLEISVNAGTTWSDDDHATADGTAVSIGGVTLSGTSSIKFRISDAASNTGAVATQAYTLDTSANTIISNAFDDMTILKSQTVTLTIVFSEEVAGFANADVTCTSGTFTTLSSSDDITWTATFTPTANTEDASNTCDIANSYTDVAGNTGATGSSANYEVDTTSPTVSSITNSDTALKSGETSTLTIVFSQAVAAFANADVTCPAGSLALSLIHI